MELLVTINFVQQLTIKVRLFISYYLLEVMKNFIIIFSKALKVLIIIPLIIIITIINKIIKYALSILHLTKDQLRLIIILAMFITFMAMVKMEYLV